MAGLLGDGWNDPQSAANMALAAGMIQGNFGSGLLGASNAYQQSQTGALNRQLTQTQISDMQQQIRLRDLQAQQAQRQMDWTNNLLGDMSSPPPVQGGMSGPATAPTAGGPLGSGTFGMPVGGQSSFSPTNAPASTGGGSLIQQARALGIPDMAIKSDLALNGGKGIAEMIYKRGTPNMQFVGNVAVDQNKVQPGFSVPTVSQNGQASQTIMDPTAPGGFRVIAPNGSLETYTAYRNADAGIAAKHDVQKVWNPDTQRYDFVSKASVLQAADPSPITNPGNMRAPGQSTGFASYPTPEAGLAAIDKNLQAYGQKGVNTVSAIVGRWAPPSENDTASYIKDVSTRLGVNPNQPLNMSSPLVRQALSTAIMLHEQGPSKVFAAAGPMAAEPSAGEAAANAAKQAGATTTATGAATAGQSYQNDLNSKVEEEYQLVNRNKQIAPLLDKFRTGGMMAEDRLHFGNAIANTGMLPDSVKKPLAAWIANGDPTAGKVIENQLASAGILNMLQTLDKEGKPNRAIFQAVQKAQEGLNSGNTTLKDVFELQNRLYRIHYDEQQALTKAIKSGSYDPRTWAGDYSSVRNGQLDQPASPLPSDKASQPAIGKVFDTMPPANPSNKGRALRDTATGRRYVSNGMQWMEQK